MGRFYFRRKFAKQKNTNVPLLAFTSPEPATLNTVEVGAVLFHVALLLPCSAEVVSKKRMCELLDKFLLYILQLLLPESLLF